MSRSMLSLAGNRAAGRLLGRPDAPRVGGASDRFEVEAEAASGRDEPDPLEVKLWEVGD